MNIVWVESRKDKLRVPKVGNNCLASRIRPIQEAKDWVEINRHKLHNTDFVFILGFGCGLHIKELCKEFPNKNFICFEKYEDLILGENMNTVKLYSPQPVVKIWSISGLENILLQNFSILKFDPCYVEDPHYYDNIVNLLTARDISSFRRVIQVESKFSNIFKKENLIPSGIVTNSKRRLLTIKDLLKADSVQKKHSKEASMWRILGELIK